MSDDLDDLGVHEVYRGVELYADQDELRLQRARLEIDLVISMSDPVALYEHACDPENPPESRLLAKNKAEQSLRDGRAQPFDPQG